MKIFITGVSSGIGRALCKQLIDSGHTVWGVARRKDLLERLKEEIKSERFIFNVCDVSNEEEVNKTAAAMDEADFLPEVVVLNAGIERKDLKNGYQVKTSEEVFLVNFFGALKWVELFIEKFTERVGGKFIAISSIFAQRPDIDSVSYCSSKSALSMAFRSLNLRYCRKKIDFTNIYFGPVDTDISSGYRDKAECPKKSFFIISPETAAKFIVKVMKRKRSSYYFPFFVTLPVRLTSFLSDPVFYKLTRSFRR
jgi:short-subunit dehydrogenase